MTVRLTMRPGNHHASAFSTPIPASPVPEIEAPEARRPADFPPPNPAILQAPPCRVAITWAAIS